MAINSFAPAIPLNHPFADDTHIRRSNVCDTLGNCVSTLHLVSELFIDERSDPFESMGVRRGMFLHLQAVTSTLEAIEECLGSEYKKVAEDQEAERQAEYEARRATEQRIESDPEVIAKTVILAKAFGEAYREVMSASPVRPATTDEITIRFGDDEIKRLGTFAEQEGLSIPEAVQGIVTDALRSRFE